MKSFSSKTLILTFFSLFIFCSNLSAQNQTLPVDVDERQNFKRLRRPNLLAELDLRPEQIQQIRRINADKKPLLRDAQIRFREATRQLDQAIYADNAVESEIQARLKEMQTAQAEMQKMRAQIEFEIRKVLSPEQLIKFREIRRQFAPESDELQNRRQKFQNDAPNRRKFNRQKRPRANF